MFYDYGVSGTLLEPLNNNGIKLTINDSNLKNESSIKDNVSEDQSK